jgi:glycosyltransferase involved in cell wall biosynthesis
MFWGRLAAWGAGVPIIVSAIHSTGWPDRIGRLNRLLTPLTDAFIGVAEGHGQYLIDEERFPGDRVHVIYNGVDSVRFQPRPRGAALLDELRIPHDAKIVGLVAVMRPEKNHELFLRAAAIVRKKAPGTYFLLIGSGPERARLERLAKDMELHDVVHFLGARSDVPDLLPLLDVFLLTSKIEASPVSILEAQACGVPVVATRVGSVAESVIDGQTGLLVPTDSPDDAASAVVRLLTAPEMARSIGSAARRFVADQRSLDSMVRGYEDLFERLYRRKLSIAQSASQESALTADLVVDPQSNNAGVESDFYPASRCEPPQIGVLRR